MKKIFAAILTTMAFFGITAVNAQNSANAAGMIKFPISNGPEANAYFIPSYKASDKVLIIFHDAFGLTDNTKKEADYLQAALNSDVTVYVVDLYDGKTSTEKFEAGKMMNNLDPARADAIIKGILNKIGSGKQIATLGWGMGGTWAFTATAMISGSKPLCTVMFYAAPPKDDIIAKSKTDVLYILANFDEHISKADMDRFSDKVKATSAVFTYESFNGKNGFANLGNAAFEQTAGKETRNMTIGYLKHKFSMD